MNTEKGGISVETEHIFPIIKRWLYSDKDIFLREIVSNACDAVTKLRRLTSLGKVSDIPDDYRIDVTLDSEAKTITVSDNGIGMTADEVRDYICKIALSGALDFIAKYESSGEDGEGADQNGIIGHFGLGFYSSFMVSDTVDVITRSYTGADAVKWSCSEAGEYELEPAEKESRGTDVVMHINEENAEYLSAYKLREILDKYCSFMPVEIYFTDKSAPAPQPEKNEDGSEKEPEPPRPINDVNPLWQKNPSDCTDEEYDAFYHKVFPDYREPLFHIHINADYPLNFKGILYFPRLNHEYDSLEGQVKLYYNQVFVADNIKEVIPEFMLMLKGVLDCPELPLNVSRSYLQNSGYVAKISAHIVKKVSDKLNSMFTLDRENYEKLWGELKLFVEYGCLRDRKFYDRVNGSLLLPLTDGRSLTFDEYLDAAKEKHENVVYYANDKVAQAQYISLFTSQGLDVVHFDRMIDTQFMSFMEQERGIKFLRVDSDIADSLKGDGEEYKNDKLVELFRKVSGDESIEVSFALLKDERLPLLLNIPEQARRMDDLMKMYKLQNGEDDNGYKSRSEAKLILNGGSELIRSLGDRLDAGEDADKCERIAKQLYMLALLAQRQLTADELQSFLNDSFSLLSL